jgi:hyperosmotically inducible periplasmic protein
MKISRIFLNASVALALAGAGNSLLIPHAYAQAGTSAAAPDNSAQNKQQSPTADNQSSAKADRTTLAEVRKAIIADKDLSTYGHNVKILVANGEVTLKGPVKSDSEKQKIVADASSVVAANNISDQLTVKQ